MKKSVLHLLLLTGAAAAILFALDRTVGRQAVGTNGFTRQFQAVNTKLQLSKPLDGKAYSIAGWHDSLLVLWGRRAGDILIFNTSTGDTVKLVLAIPAIADLEPFFHTSFLYPNVFITGTNARKIIRSNLEKRQTEVFDLPIGPALNTVMLSSDHGVFRVVDTARTSLRFVKLNIVSGTPMGNVPADARPADDVFTYDGSVSYDRTKRRLSYVNFYSNGISIFDTSLNLVARMQTIDTTNTPKVSVAHLEESQTYKKPPQTVNLGAGYFDGTLFVHSRLLADNELQGNSEGNVVLDQYTNQYAGSFTIPVQQGKMNDFSVYKEKIAVISKDTLKIFRRDH